MKKLHVIFLFAFLVGCSSNRTVLPSVTQTVFQRSNPFATNTPFFSPRPTPNPPTITRLPTLQPTEAEALILQLLKDNGSCQFPCWWNFTPGETNTQLVRPLLEQLNIVSLNNNFYTNVGGASWLLERDNLLIDIIFSFTFNRVFPDADTIESLRVHTEIKRELPGGGFEIVWENSLNEQFLHNHMLPQILSTYDPPNDVLIFANKGWRYFELILDYSNQGFVIRYSAPLESSGDNFLGCPSKFTFDLYAWIPELNYTWAEGITGTGDEYEINSLHRDFIPLEESTSMKLSEFYENFKNPANTNCIETPKDIWSGP